MIRRERSFIGRADERALAARHLGDPAVGARIVYVDGPAGIGKTAFTEQVEADWSVTGGVSKRSRCWDGPGTPPLWPWLQLLGNDAMATQDTPVLPSGSDRRSVELARFTRFTEVVEGLARLSASRPTLFVIEDVHWADEATLDCLHFVAREPRATDVTIIVTSRTPDADLFASAPLLAEVAHQSARITLGGLRRSEVAELAEQFDARGTADVVFERTGGHPLYAIELLRLQAAGVGIEDRTAVPQTVGAVIRRHLEVLGPEIQQVLQLAATHGQFFDPAVLAVAAGETTNTIDSMLSEARRYDLVRPSDGLWMFVHALIGDAFLDDVPIERRAVNHLAIANALERRRGANLDDVAGTICFHLRGAGTLCATDRLFAWARRAAVSARSRLAWETEATFWGVAAGSLRDALTQQTASDPTVSLIELIEVLIEQCRAEKLARLIDAARITAMEAAQLARELDDPVWLAEVALVYPPDSEGIEIDEIHDPEQVRIRFDALSLLPTEEVALRIQLQASLALSLYWETPTGDRAESHDRSAAQRDELTSSALASARELNDPAVLATALDARIHATWGPATASERPELAEELYAVALPLGDTRRVLAARTWRIAELLESTRFDEAEREIEAYEADVVRINDRVGRWTVLRWRSNRAFISGDLVAAEELAEEALAVAVEVLPEHVSMSFYVTMVGPIHYLTGSLAKDLAVVTTIAEESPDVPAWRVGIAAALSETGDLEAAARELRLIAADDFAMLPRDLNFFGAMIMLALVSLNVGDAEVARAIRPHLEPRAGRYAIHGTGYTSYGPVDLALAQLAHAEGAHEDARRYYESAIELADQVGTPYAFAARMYYAILLMGTDRTHSRSLLEDARTGFETVGAAGMITRCEERLAELDEAASIALRCDDRGEWTLHQHDDSARSLGGLKGLRALRELVLHPHQFIHAITLSQVIEGTTGELLVGDGELPAHLDEVAVGQFRRRVEKIRVELDRADRRGDVARSSRLQTELDALTDRLLGAEGFGGRAMHDPTNADRARVNITKHVKRSIDRVASVDRELGQHLRSSISTGMHCVYAPAVNSDIRWQV